MKSSTFSRSLRYAAAVGATALMVGVPAHALASTASGSINESSLIATTTRPVLSGSASGTKAVRLIIRKEGSTKTFYASAAIRVKNGTWKARITKKLPDATYEVRLSKNGSTKLLEKDTLVIDTDGGKGESRSTSVLSVSSIPLLSGGMTRGGASVPISYLKTVNTGKEPLVIKGFGLRQNGSAPTKSIIGLTVSDDAPVSAHGASGGIEGSVPFKDGVAFVTMETTIAPGAMRLFTIKAIMAADVSNHIGKQLMIDVASVSTNGSTRGSFPIRGTTWTIGY